MGIDYKALSTWTYCFAYCVAGVCASDSTGRAMVIQLILSGYLDFAWAVEIARGVKGVKSVKNSIIVK